MNASETDRKSYRPTLERALSIPEHRLMGLTALVRFWPSDRSRFFGSLKQQVTDLESLERQLDKALALMR